MSNGAECCALEICCPGPENRPKRAKMLADVMGLDVSKGQILLDWMDTEGLAFAPASMRAVIADIVTSVRTHG